MFTFLIVIRQNFEYNLRIVANIRIKSKKSMDFTHTFSKNYSFGGDFLIKDYPFYTNFFFLQRKMPKVS